MALLELGHARHVPKLEALRSLFMDYQTLIYDLNIVRESFLVFLISPF